ncbi:MAG: imidazole glycerol phosphate synthase subunit HisF [Longimicrobiales bacterium]
MLHKRIVVCLVAYDGRLATRARFRDLGDPADPAQVAARYEAEGADEVLLVDGSGNGGGPFLDLVRRTAQRLFIPLSVAGGFEDLDTVAAALRAGADRVSLNTAAVEHPELISMVVQRFGSASVTVGIDAKVERRRGEMSSDQAVEGVLDEQLEDLDWYRVFTHHGRTATSRNAVAWAEQCAQLGCGEIRVNSIDRDSIREGYDLELTARIVERVNVPVMASGGAGDASHMRDAFVIAGADAALAGPMFHDGAVRILDVKRELDAVGVPVRLPPLRDSRPEAAPPIP